MKKIKGIDMIYFDNAASSPLREEVLDVMKEELSLWANPSSLHRLGFEAEKRLKKAREQVAAAIFSRPEEIFFTSGGTEADNMAIFGAAKKMQRRGKKILATDSEHPAVEECLKRLEEEGFSVHRLSTKKGVLSLDEIRENTDETTVLAAIMHTNNETGAVYDVSAVSRIVKEKNPSCLVFSDGVQGFGKSKMDPKALGVDLLSLSSHKVHGPKGVGALYVKKGLQLPPLLYGGGQEKGMRNGTENLPGIIAFGKAAELATQLLEENTEKMRLVRQRILEGVRGNPRIIPNLPDRSSDHILSLQVKGFPSEVLLHMLSEYGVFVSSGSACSSHKGKSSVLTSFGLTPQERDCTIRLSFSSLNTEKEADEFLKILKKVMG